MIMKKISGQLSIFERVTPIAVYEHNADLRATMQTQAKIYCRVCGALVCYGGMLSKRLTASECAEQAQNEWVNGRLAITDDGRCANCGTIVRGMGTLYGGLKN